MAMRLRRDFEACECLCVLHVKHQTASRALGKVIGGVGFTYLSRPRLPTGPLAMSQQRNHEMVLIATVNSVI